MARTKSVAPEALAAVGAEALAEVLVDHADTDPALRKKLAMLLFAPLGILRSFANRLMLSGPGTGWRIFFAI